MAKKIKGLTVAYENSDITTIVDFVFVGYGLNAQAVFAKRITTYSISDGIIKNNEYIPAKCWYR